MGHSLRDARVLGLSPLYEHTSKGKESDREIWGPLHYAASDSHPCTASMPRPSPQMFSNHNTPRWPHFLCLCGLFSVKALALGQDLLNLQWLIVAIVLAHSRGSPGCCLSSPLAGPACSAFLLALSLLSLQPFLSSLCPPEASKLSCSRFGWPCLGNDIQQAMRVTYAGSSPYVQTSSNAPGNRPSASMCSGFLLYPSCPDGRTDNQNWGLGLTACCYNCKLQILLWRVMGGSTHRHMCTPEQSWTQRCPLRDPAWGAGACGLLYLAALCQQCQPLGSTWPDLRSSAPLFRVLGPRDTQ